MPDCLLTDVSLYKVSPYVCFPISACPCTWLSPYLCVLLHYVSSCRGIYLPMCSHKYNYILLPRCLYTCVFPIYTSSNPGNPVPVCAHSYKSSYLCIPWPVCSHSYNYVIAPGYPHTCEFPFLCVLMPRYPHIDQFSNPHILSPSYR